MNEDTFKDIVLCGETTKVQFKEVFTSQREIAKEMIAFANSKGGIIIFGVEDKTGCLKGLTYEQIQATSRELGNAANEQVRPTIYIETEVLRLDGKHFLVCSVEEGRNKPYKNLNGEIWVKQGADKRRITENSEILALFQDSGSYQTDAAGVDGTTLSDLDRYAIDEYLMRVYSLNMESLGEKAEQMLKNIHVLNHSGKPTLAGYLFFGKHPEYNCPTCMVKAVSFFGNELGGTQYRDTKEILGNMPQVYEKSMTFLKSNLHNIQEEGASFNTLGKLEISESALEEVLQNALIHRDLLRPAPIRIFIFDNRVEIISPGALAGGLTEEDVRNGKTYQRNPFMATFATNALHYRGIGSGIVRLLAECPNMVFTNDSDGNEFKVTLFRGILDTTQKSDSTTQKSDSTTQKSDSTTPKSGFTTQKSDSTTPKRVLEYFSLHPKATRGEVAEALGDITEDGVKFIIAKLQKKGVLKRIGGRKHGEWVTDISEVSSSATER